MTTALSTPDADAPTPPSPRHTLPDGRAYLQSLRDDREVYLNGQRIDDVTTHPGLRNAAHSVARLYDALHEPDAADTLTCPSDFGGLTHRFFTPARTPADLLAARDAIAAWSRLTFGWMGRTPDYKASLTQTFGPAAEFYGPFASAARQWHRRAQLHLPFLSHALANPPIDRDRPVEEIRDVVVRSTRETSEGIIVSGAKVVATSAAITNACFIGQTPGTASDDPEQALSFIVPINAPGVRLICRSSYEWSAARGATPFDAPLSSRFDENDAILTLDRVLIPWENVLIHRDPARVRRFFHATGFLPLFLMHGCTRLAVKLDFLTGLMAKALRLTGGHTIRGKRAMLGELVALSHTFWSLSTAMASNPEPWADGRLLPDRRAAMAYCVLAPDCYPRVRDIIQRTLGSALVYLPSSARDLEHPTLDPLLSRYVRGSGGAGHRERIKTLKLLWDAIGSEFASRHELYERNYAGGWECIRLMVAGEAEHAGRLRHMEDLADRCMRDYDERGWRTPHWINPAPHP